MSRKKLETIGTVATLCAVALSLAKAYQLYQVQQRRKLKEIAYRQTYDLVMCINGDPNHGDWELATFKEQSQKEEVAVSVFGDFNVGKTFVINHISGLTLPSGETDHTVGISIKSTVHGIRWIDTAGMGAPYCVRSQTPEERYGTEHLIGELAYRLSDAQIVVVSHCSLRDQEFIHALHNWQIHENRPGKNLLVVVHNYCRVADPCLLRVAFVNDVVSRFCIEEIVLPDRHDPKRQRKVWVDKSDGYPIYHVLLGREGTLAGDQYNEDAFNTIFALCTARLGFSSGQNYLDVSLQDLNDDLLQKYFGTRLRLRLNDLRTKLVPDEDLFQAYNYHHFDNGGSHPTKQLATAATTSTSTAFADPQKPQATSRTFSLPAERTTGGSAAGRCLVPSPNHFGPL
eukprot:GGOE01019183.1.p1 GENE.GGOE01019183.1~~GGOE01019183.1.p1  ORF type:complete len:399 (-),score=97.69 GGOE01019183.1:627-1823(-)